MKNLIILICAFALCGCQSPFISASTKVEITKGDLTLKYSSPKDQRFEYDPVTGKVVLESTTNTKLASTESESIKAISDGAKEIIKRIP